MFSLIEEHHLVNFYTFGLSLVCPETFCLKFLVSFLVSVSVFMYPERKSSLTLCIVMRGDRYLHPVPAQYLSTWAAL